MGCGCGGSATKKMAYVYTGPDGKRTTYTSEVQARAAVIRNKGGTYYAKPA